MGLDGKVTDSNVSFQKSDFNLIPVETRTGVSKHSHRIPRHEPDAQPGENSQQKKARRGGNGGSKSWNSGTHRIHHNSKAHFFKGWGASWAENA
eukprot:CAMPEP_0172159586 /NCGR_PEP_ID=MMETSP1050-20130122/5057_1 /TAXON_ID=233186 /ORGANISM="Cryptomonas curvata, Strain CCAP979/52" /LENGTH=93 /DNA_ID=CAMNT_0012829199 /DNA_START=587 /DNA_END=868 /DNA_ORIENTATION=+